MSTVSRSIARQRTEIEYPRRVPREEVKDEVEDALEPLRGRFISIGLRDLYEVKDDRVILNSWSPEATAAIKSAIEKVEREFLGYQRDGDRYIFASGEEAERVKEGAEKLSSEYVGSLIPVVPPVRSWKSNMIEEKAYDQKGSSIEVNADEERYHLAIEESYDILHHEKTWEEARQSLEAAT